MALFGKKKHDIDEENLLQDEAEGFTVYFNEDDEKEENHFRGQHRAPHAITIDEVLHNNTAPSEKPVTPTFAIPMSNDGEYSAAARNLMNRMMKAKQVVEQTATGTEEAAPQLVAEEKVAEPAPEKEEDEGPTADDSKVDDIIAKAQKAAAAKVAPATAPKTEFASPEFMEKLKGFLNDETDTAPTTLSEPDTSYSLASVDDILRSVEKKVKKRTEMEQFKKGVDINYGVPAAEEKVEEEVAPQPVEIEPQVTIYQEQEVPVQIDVVHIDPADDDLESTRPVPLSYQFSFADEDLPNTDIGAMIATSEAENEDTDGAEEKTIQFEAISSSTTQIPDSIVSSVEAERKAKLTSFKLDPIEDEEDEEEDDDFENEIFNDYSCIDDAPSFRRDLKKHCSTLLLKIVPTAILTLLMGILSLPVFVGVGAENGMVFRCVSLALLGITLIINLTTVLSIGAIFRGEPDMDSPIGLAAVLVFIYSATCITLPGAITLGAPVGLVLLAASFGKYTIEKRIATDFDRIATSDSKLAVNLIDEDQGSAEIAKGSGLENVLVCGTQRTVNVTGFFKKCYTQQSYERMIPGVLIAGGAVSIIAGAIAFVLSSDIVASLGWALAIFAMFCPPSYCLISALPYASAAKNVAESGGLICGLGGAENISDANAVVFNADQLFPAGTVNLYQMKILSPNPIDHAIVEAAAVATAAKSPLADMFNRMAQGREDVVSDPVDTVNLEGNMGISGWIKDRRILIGNRLLMETHGVPIPPVTVDRNILEKGFFPVYVACAGVPCALFVVGYNVDLRIRYELQRLCNTGAVILVNSTDPNISEEMISDYFGIYRESVRLMNAVSLNLYKNAVNYQESFPASALYNGAAEALACLMTSSVRLRSLIRFCTALNFVFIGLGALLCCYSIFIGAASAMAAPAVLILHLLNLCAAVAVPFLFKP